MEQAQITVANQTISLCFHDLGCASGTLVRLDDGLEASFSGPECLLHLLEGIVGRRAWQSQQAQIVATVTALCSCA
jgi:hypothetical protein